MNEIEICTLNGVKWILGDEAPERMTWKDAKDWCESIGQQLPPREVLFMAYLNPEIRGGFASNFYWSSSEDDSNNAWSQNFNYGYQSNYDKYNTLPVRAVRAIKVEGLKPEQEPFKPDWVNYRQGVEDATREPLSDEEIADLWWNNYVGTADSARNFAKAIEQAHGIGGDE